LYGQTSGPIGFAFQTINHKHVIPANMSFPRRRESSITNQTVPLSRGRVARIVPEFWAQTTAENGTTPCAPRNKEFLARGVFYLLNCCRNVDSQAADGQRKCRPRGGGEWAAARAFLTMDPICPQGEGPLPKGRRGEAVQSAGMVGPYQAQGAAESDASVRL
jgi:hypothetical protein